ncbi:MAG TPA: hypothetical protein VFT72_20665 [Opitutaceae bacterium]|nr:hypothetical protein [Opitutaceae bacterium]
MKIKQYLSAALLTAATLSAAPLTSTTAVHVKPSATSPVITVLNAGTEPTPAIGVASALPKGWSAIELNEPHEAYIANRDLTKELDARPGSAFRTLPKADAPVLSTMQPGDQFEVTGYHGKWTQVKLTKKIIGYVQGWSGSAPAASVALNTPAASNIPAAAPTPAPTPTPAPNIPFSPSPAAPAAMTGSGAGQPVNLGDGGSSALPRLFQGKFVSTRSLLRPRRPYDYQLNDSSGQRYGYVNVSRLLQTEQIDKYIDHTVTIYGTAKPVEGTKDIVIEAESLQLH